jgi:hypothetical protein
MKSNTNDSLDFSPKLPLWSFRLLPDSKLGLRTRKDLENHLITRALKEPEFRSKLLTEPKAVVEAELGIQLPPELQIVAIEETETEMYLVLPCNPYEGFSEEALLASGKTYDEIARLVLERQRHSFLDEDSSATVIARMWRDPVFKRRMISDPAAVIEEEFGFSPPSELTIHVCEERADRICIVMPCVRDHELDEANEARAISGLNRPLLIAACTPSQVTIADSLLTVNCNLCTQTTGRSRSA